MPLFFAYAIIRFSHDEAHIVKDNAAACAIN